MILLTPGSGFIGSHFMHDFLVAKDEDVINFDKHTFAWNTGNLYVLDEKSRHIFVQGDIVDQALMKSLFVRYLPRAVIYLAAKSHVDCAILGPEDFIQSNIVGTFRLLEFAKVFWKTLNEMERGTLRFLHVTIDEAFGSISANTPAFAETNHYEPNISLSASKASDYIVRTHYLTFRLPELTTNCSNNHGPFQLNEKLIPLIIHYALAHILLTFYDDGLQIIDWLNVSDHCSSFSPLMEFGYCGEVYHIGGLNENANNEILHIFCDIINELCPIPASNSITSNSELITFVKDYPGDDQCYVIDTSIIKAELNWRPSETYETCIL